jgi:hypothetical protein
MSLAGENLSITRFQLDQDTSVNGGGLVWVDETHFRCHFVEEVYQANKIGRMHTLRVWPIPIDRFICDQENDAILGRNFHD